MGPCSVLLTCILAEIEFIRILIYIYICCVCFSVHQCGSVFVYIQYKYINICNNNCLITWTFSNSHGFEKCVSEKSQRRRQQQKRDIWSAALGSVQKCIFCFCFHRIFVWNVWQFKNSIKLVVKNRCLQAKYCFIIMHISTNII